LALLGVEAGSETKDAHVISFINHVRQGQALSKDKVFTWQLILDRVPTRLHASFAGGISLSSFCHFGIALKV
jgi:hypothetical protein